MEKYLGRGTQVRITSVGKLQNVIGTIVKCKWYMDNCGARRIFHIHLGRQKRQSFSLSEFEIV